MATATHHGVVTLVHGNSLYLWDLDEDAPWHLSRGQASDGSRPYVGAVVRIVLEDGKPASIDPSDKAELNSKQMENLASVIDIDELNAARNRD